MPMLTLTLATTTDDIEWTRVDGPITVTAPGPVTPAALTARAIDAARFWRDHTGHPGNVRATLTHQKSRLPVGPVARGYGHAVTPAPRTPAEHLALAKAYGHGVYLAATADEYRAAGNLVAAGVLAPVGLAMLPATPDGPARRVSRYVPAGPHLAEFVVHRRTGTGGWLAHATGTRQLTDADPHLADLVAATIAEARGGAGYDTRVTLHVVDGDGRPVMGSGRSAPIATTRA